MTGLVVDASVALAWIFQDEANSYAESILRIATSRTLIVPAHWMLEVTNALLSAERKGQVSVADSTRGLALLAGLRFVVDPHTTEKAQAQTLGLARTHRLTIYDAAYLELSLREGTGLATLDGDLIAACKASGVLIA